MLVTFRYCENTSIGLRYSRRSIFSALVESLWNCTQIPQIHSKYTPSKKCTRVRAAHPEDWETRQVGQTAFRIRVQDKQTSQNFECLQSRLQLLFTLHSSEESSQTGLHSCQCITVKKGRMIIKCNCFLWFAKILAKQKRECSKILWRVKDLLF